MVDGAKIFISVFFILFSVGSALETGDQDVVTMNRKHDGAPCELCKKSVTIFSSEVKKICRLPIWKKTLICNTSSNKTETFVQTLSIKDARSVCSKIGLCRAHSSGNGIGIETVCKLCKGLKSYFEGSIRRDEAAGKTMKTRFKKFINQAFRAFNPCQDKVMEKYCPRDTKEPDDDTCGIVKIKPKLGIIGGFEAYKGQFPWQAQIQILQQNGHWRHYCGGTLIRDEWILSAAHCFTSGNKSDFKFVLGQYDRSRKDGTEQEFSASRIITHENYNDSIIENDITLIKLNGKVKINDYVRTACMPKKGEQFTNLKCTASGWGRLVSKVDGTLILPNILNAVQVHIMTLQDCRQDYQQYGVSKIIFDTNVCTGYEQEDQGVCYGDSGGPLACKKYNEPWKVTGITSWRLRGCYKAAVYTGVASYIDWINRTISKY